MAGGKTIDRKNNSSAPARGDQSVDKNISQYDGKRHTKGNSKGFGVTVC